jgi:DNA-binding response OmpR family regulator
VGVGEARTILVVDDDPSIRLLCRVNLELEGFAVLEAHNLESAVEQAPLADLVLLDLHLGTVRGPDVVEPVRRASPNVPVVLLTGTIDVDPVVLQSVAGVVTKPFTIDALLAATGRFTGSV